MQNFGGETRKKNNLEDICTDDTDLLK